MMTHHGFLYISHEVKDNDKYLSLYKKEMLVLFAVQKWKQYLLGRKLKTFTDHKPLKYLIEQGMYTEAQNAWLVKLHDYQFEVEYKKGKDDMAVHI